MQAKSSIKNNKRIIEQTDDVFIEPLGVRPPDHKGVFAEFELKSYQSKSFIIYLIISVLAAFMDNQA